jgi:putative transposase
LSCLTYAASKLWNVANYERTNWTIESGIKYPDWYNQKSRLKDDFWYKNLPSQSAQELLKQLEESWRSYYKLRNTGGIKNPNPPGYKHSNFNLRYLNNGFKVNEGNIRLSIPKQQKQYLMQKYDMEVDYLYIPIPAEYEGYEGNTKVIEIIPEKDKYRIAIIIELPKLEVKQDNRIYMGIDLGVNNLITCHVSTGKSFIISGRQLLSINRYYDKTIGYYQSIAYADQSAGGIKYPKDTKRIKQLYGKRVKQVNHLLHAATSSVIRIAEQENVSKIIIGDVTHIRDDKDIGRKNNQKFHRWPYARIADMLIYKAQDKKIAVEKQEESYTSQCSPYAVEVSEMTADKKNRKYRGLYIVKGMTYNADCIGAYNILKKYLCRIGRPNPAVVGLDTPDAYRWNYYSFVGSSKLAISMVM